MTSNIIKIPRRRWSREVRGNQYTTWKCYVDAIKSNNNKMEVDIPNKESNKNFPQQEDQRGAVPARVQSAEELLSIQLVLGEPDRITKTTNDLIGIDPSIVVHSLNVDPTFLSVKLKKRHFGPEKDKIIQEEVSNKWLMCIDFRDINKVCPKDFYPLPRIDQLVDSTFGHELLSLMDASQERSLLFFKALRKTKDFIWDEDYQQAFRDLKAYLAQLPLFTKPTLGETVYLYLAASQQAVSSMLIKEEGL
ncbi:UNVERIFIED_CONTAM: hypothetical protein Scaly_3033900 [Sesamum calycinum]|uniref:Reverse transcriptase/retrotransposon-derived protein RNase H-like domain-containing protein n=1 Tax=Sesamum calycinum TaxID=2727403 RepID=A0AAW2K8K9_9LAMI